MKVNAFFVALLVTCLFASSTSFASESSSEPTAEPVQMSEGSGEDPSIIWKYCDKYGNCIYCNDETGKCGILV